MSTHASLQAKLIFCHRHFASHLNVCYVSEERREEGAEGPLECDRSVLTLLLVTLSLLNPAAHGVLPFAYGGRRAAVSNAQPD